MNVIHWYRFAHKLHLWRVPLLPRLIKYLMFVLYNSDIPPSCSIGAGCIFGHGGIGVVLHPQCRIGDRVLIGQGITIGGTFGSGVPSIGNDVWLGPGARVLGDVQVGNNVVIGANAVVVKDVQDNCIVAGVPAKVIRNIKPGSLDTLSGTISPETGKS